MSQLAPLGIKSRLAPTPKNPPRYSVTAQLKSGESLKLADPKSTRAMVALMDMAALHGGAASHFGGPSAFAELMSATHALMFHQATLKKQSWAEEFHFVNDAGHCENGIYALKANYSFADLRFEELKKFRSIESFLTGHGEAHLFPQGILISNGPLGSGLPQAQGLAVADALAGRKRTTICALSDGGAMEGEARESFAAIPGLAQKGKLAPFVLIISDNRTKLSGRIETDAYSMQPTFNSLKEMGWKVLQLEDGHDLQACLTTLEEALLQVSHDPTVPVAIHARTIKGKGSQKAEASNSGAHGFHLKSADELPALLTELYAGTEVPSEFLTWAQELKAYEMDKAAKKTVAVASTTASAPIWKTQPSEKIQLGISNAMIKSRQAGRPVVSVSADLQGSTGVADFHKAYSVGSFDVGVAEANMISTAIGLSVAGYVPVVDTFAQFGVTKGALPITMANLSLAPVIGVFSHTGFQDAADGASHQALSFYAQLASVPHTELYALSSSSEAEALMSQAIEDFCQMRLAGQTPPTRVFFLGRENFARRYVTESVSYKLGQAQVVLDTTSDSTGAGNSAISKTGAPKSNRAVTLVSTGSMLGETLKAAEHLSSQQIGCIVINASCINKPDLACITAALGKTGGNLVTIEEHRMTSGFGAILSHALALADVQFKLRSIAIGDHFGQSAYSALDLYKKHGLDSTAIQSAAQSLF